MIKRRRCRGIKCVQKESIDTSGPTLRRLRRPHYIYRAGTL